MLDENGELALLDCPVRRRVDYEHLLRHARDVRRFGKSDEWYQPLVYENPLYDWSASIRLLSASGVRLRRRCFNDEPPVRGGVFNIRSTAFRIQRALLERFAFAVHATGTRALIVMLPDERVVRAAQQGEAGVYDPLTDMLRARGLEVADAADAFARSRPAEQGGWFASGGHYSPVGNRIVARWLAGEIRRRFGDIPRSRKAERLPGE